MTTMKKVLDSLFMISMRCLALQSVSALLIAVLSSLTYGLLSAIGLMTLGNFVVCGYTLLRIKLLQVERTKKETQETKIIE